MSNPATRYQFIIGATISAPLTPLYQATDGLVYPITSLVALQVRRFVGLSKSARAYDANRPTPVSVYQDGDLIAVSGLTVGLEYHLGIGGISTLAALNPVDWSLRIGQARSSSRLLYRRGDAGLVARLLAESIQWRNFTATAGQRIFTLLVVPASVVLVVYDGAVLTPGSGLFTWSPGSPNVELTFDAVADAPLAIATM